MTLPGSGSSTDGAHARRCSTGAPAGLSRFGRRRSVLVLTSSPAGARCAKKAGRPLGPGRGDGGPLSVDGQTRRRGAADRAQPGPGQHAAVPAARAVGRCGWCSAPRAPGRAPARSTATRSGAEWPADPEIVERVPLRSCARRGAAIDVVADAGQGAALADRVHPGPGPGHGVLAVPADPQAGPAGRAGAHGAGGRDRRLQILVDAHERYAYRFAGKPDIVRRGLPLRGLRGRSARDERSRSPRWSASRCPTW